MFALAILISILPFLQEKIASAETLTEIISKAERYYERRDNPENLLLAIEAVERFLVSA
ncbi:MAG: hypothetical protein ACE5IC_09450 [Candidatus Brocadiales bacterium]